MRYIAALIVLAIFIVLCTGSEKAHASEPLSGSVVTLQNDSAAYSDKSTESTIVTSFSKGDAVFVTGTTDEWMEIMYDGEVAYIPIKSVASDLQQAEINMDEMAKSISEEFAENQRKESTYVDVFQRRERTKQNAHTWKMIIVLLVGALIVISAFSGVKKKKRLDKEDNAD